MNLAGGNIVVSVFPDMPTPGALGAFTRPEKINEIRELEKSKTSRLWEVRAFISDHVPLAGNPPDTLKEAGHHFLHVNPAENPRGSTCMREGEERSITASSTTRAGSSITSL